jgi:uncharacterized protein
MKMFAAKEEKNLNRLLCRTKDPEAALCLEELHGFLFGLAITPEPIMPSEWFPIIFGDDGPMFDDEKDAQACIGGLMATYNRIMQESNKGILRFPFDYKKMNDDDLELIEGWAYGLYLALSLRRHLWGLSEEIENMDEKDIPADLKEVIDSCAIITAVAMPEERREIILTVPGRQPKSDKELQVMLYGMLPVCVEAVQKYGDQLRRKMFAGLDETSPDQQRSRVKVGRNDPCPCGSGKKYKKCCGAN